MKYVPYLREAVKITVNAMAAVFSMTPRCPLAMKLTPLAVFLLVLNTYAETSLAQRVSIRANNVPLENVLREIRKQSGYDFLIKEEYLSKFKPVSLEVSEMEVGTLLPLVFANQQFEYSVNGKIITLVPKRTSKASLPVETVQQTVQGTVKDETGALIAGASIYIKGTQRGTMTNDDGRFVLPDVPAGATLVISNTGYETREVAVGSQTALTITLTTVSQEIDEVVVVAYGTAKKKDFTGSITSVSSDDITQQQVSTVSQALEGKVAGIQLTSPSGQPGNDSKIRVRGMGSINASNDPLIVVDGAVFNLGLSALNPDDVESIVVSKDAAANAIYGSRAANGLILVTTKKGKSGTPKIGVDLRWGAFSQGVPDMEVVRDPGTYYEYTWQGIYNYMRYKQGYTDADARQYASDNLFTANGASNTGNGLGNYMNYKIPEGTTLIDPATGKIRTEAALLYHDSWPDYFLKTALRQEYNTNISGASEKTDYYVSLGMLKNPSYVMGSEFNRYSARVNLNTQIASWLKGGANMSYSKNYSNAPTGYTGGTTNTNIFTFMNLFAPTYPIYAYDANGQIIRDADGKPVYDLGTNQTYSPYGSTARNAFNGYSPAVYFEKDLTETTNDFFSGRGYLEAKFLKDFTLKADVAVDNSYQNYLEYGNNESGSDARDYEGRIRSAFNKAMTLNLTQLLTWNRSFGEHTLDALVGHEFNKFQSDNINGTKYKMYALDNPSMGNAVRVLDLTGGDEERTLEGYFSRVNYNYAEKYYLSASLRTDGSSYFRGNRWGTFWSLGGAYRIGEENFIKDNADWITDLRLRGSYGVQGNNGVPVSTRYAWTNTYGLSAVGSITDAEFALSANTWGDPSITWESNHIVDGGLDFRLWNRFYGTVDYFRRKTVDLLLSVSYPASAGRAGALRNVGKLLNTGLEVDLGVDIIRKPDLNWSFNINASRYRTTLLEIPDNMKSSGLDGGYLSGNFLRREGTDYFNLYMYRYAGVDQETGLGMLYKKLTEADLANYPGKSVGDVVTTTVGSEATRFELGTSTPDLVGGASTTVRYKDFDLGVAVSYQLGGKVVSRTYQYITGQSIGRGVHVDLLDAWTPENTDSNIPMRMLGDTNFGSQPIGGGEGQYSDFSLFDADYFNLRSINLGYRLSSSLTQRLHLQGLRVYVAADNLYFVSAKKGVDPRQVLDGVSVNPFNYPQTKSISFGLNISL
ncbi:TonB-linked outer membrane protein, SusC/RagA family [Parapedobacter indicus]|uniref:TonB-linked outer membrane protein, SusC/RagA family n=2 Tax=Parapedobacter indicus TaxID=1477437 RepID=A0A1I3H927_9SPHI|nr:SusC/RagA family TonB-linked outer membrane protein [Parapedobacter indicus]PPL02944.1 TonB-linked SusC/RagA family outer membrane protein [Parapedobacter indicus]SFI32246.1 TonB-linked outer membrane protein, SusC/RagA family [Parapedobacter indicus]